MMAKAKEVNFMIKYDVIAGFYYVDMTGLVMSAEIFELNQVAHELNRNLIRLRELSAS